MEKARIEFYIDIASTSFAAIVAVLWFMSARVKTPKKFQDHRSGQGVDMGTMSDKLRELGNAVKERSQLSALAAASAGVAAVLQAISIQL